MDSEIPRPVRIAIATAVVAQLIYLLVFFWVLFLQGTVLATWGAAAVGSIASVLGLPRRLTWARYFSALTLSLLTIIVFVHVMPISGRPDPHFLEKLFGFMPDLIVLWFIIVVASFVLLAPIAIMSAYSSTFRKAWW